MNNNPNIWHSKLPVPRKTHKQKILKYSVKSKKNKQFSDQQK